ncbi:hypothetical protein JOM56_008890 [Amanita muscaria]
MKPLTEQNLVEYTAAIRRGAFEGAAGGTIIAVSTGWYLNRHWATYRKMPLSLKALGGVIIIAPLLAIQAERRGLQYDRSQWQGLTVDMLDGKQQRKEELWQELSAKDKIAHWAENHQYSLIFGGWASSLATAGGIIWRDKYMTPAQKIVQARMWAQGMTIGLLIVVGALTHSRKLAQANHAHPDHSWADVLEQHEKERLEAKQLAQAASDRQKVGRESFNVDVNH